jgi:hypothetical protein
MNGEFEHALAGADADGRDERGHHFEGQGDLKASLKTD